MSDITIANTVLETAGRLLKTYETILDKAKAYGEKNGVSDEVILTMRVHPTMLPFHMQIVIGTDILRRGLIRLQGDEPAAMEDGPLTLESMARRVAATIAVLEELDHDRVNADPKGDITIPFGPTKKRMTRQDYALQFIIPNVLFHVTVAYLMLRQVGVDLGKQDFLQVDMTDM